jgi:hypothetical protein
MKPENLKITVCSSAYTLQGRGKKLKDQIVLPADKKQEIFIIFNRL